MEKKYHIEKNTVQETLIIPLYGRKVCSDYYPELFEDSEAERICGKLDYDFENNGKKMRNVFGLFGAMEVAQRHFDIIAEAKEYLKRYPKASIVNLGCGLDDTFEKADNGECRGYNIDFEDVIRIREEIFGKRERQENIASDLMDFSWMDRIEKEDGVFFFAAGVFYYLKKEDVIKLSEELSRRFPGAVLVFDACNAKGAKMMTKTWLKGAGIRDVSALFSIEEAKEVRAWSDHFASVTSKSYMRGYRDIYPDVSFLHKMMILLCDHIVKMIIVKITFKGE